MQDLALIETGNGGDLVLTGNDFAAINGAENLVYLCLFGGDADGWLFDELFYPGDSARHFKSTTGQVLASVPLTSAGRIAIEQAIMSDLDTIKTLYPGTKLSVQVQIVADDRIEMRISLLGTLITYAWNPITQQLQTIK